MVLPGIHRHYKAFRDINRDYQLLTTGIARFSGIIGIAELCSIVKYLTFCLTLKGGGMAIMLACRFTQEQPRGIKILDFSKNYVDSNCISNMNY